MNQEQKEFLLNRELLRAYKDTGLEPEEIKRLIVNSAYGVKQAMLEEYMSIGTIDHLRELAQAEQDGRLVVLPCRIGDPVWLVISKRWKNCPDYPVYQFIKRSTLTWNNLRYITAKIGKTVFLTEAEAEAAVEKENNDG